MLYANRNFKTSERSFDFGKRHQLALGEEGRGRKLVPLTCPSEISIPAFTLVKELTIGKTQSGRPRIIKAGRNDCTLFMLIDSYVNYSRRGCGYVMVLNSQVDDFDVIARGNGADGDAGRIGSWVCPITKCPANGIVRIKYSGSGYGIPSDLLIIKDNSVYKCQLKNLDDCCDSLGIDLAAEYPDFKVDEDGCYDDSCWSIVRSHK